MENQSKWYAVRVRSRCEKSTAWGLEQRGFEVYDACAPQRRIWKDRVRVVEVPAFPGYIFARFVADQGLGILQAAGVISIIGFGNQYAPVEDREIEALQLVMKSGRTVEAVAALQPGTRVRVVRGPLRGAEGIFTHGKGGHRLMITVTLLHRSVATEIDALSVEPIQVRASGVAA